MNNFSVSIGGLAYKNAVFPLKYEDLLDEQLNSAVLGLTRVSTPYFKPATPVFITITSKNTANGVEYNQTKTLEYVISNDRSIESPVGSGFYRHEITLIEPTKLLEIPLESLCFRNAGAREFEPQLLDFEEFNFYSPYYEPTESEAKERVRDYFGHNNPMIVGKYKSLPDPWTLRYFIGDTYIIGLDFDAVLRWDVEITRPNGNNETYSYVGTNEELSEKDVRVKIESGLNIIKWWSDTANYNAELEFKTTIVGLPDILPLAPYSIQEVIDRVLELQEPLIYDSLNQTYGIQPRFRFDLSKIPTDKQELFTRRNAPEFTFTRCTLREALQTIGGYIHAEPKLLYNAETGEFDTITFDFYGVEEYAEYYDVNHKALRRLSDYNYEDKTLSWNIEQGCNELDAYVENLVNRINAGSATTAQPIKVAHQSLRTESAYVQFTDDNSTMYFPTDYPIHEIKAFYWYDPDSNKNYDLTAYVYERNIYDSQLSSYEDVYPISKAYGLYYTLGEKGIKGFFFKNEEVNQVFARYAIVNIIEKATGKNITQSLNNYLKLQFRLEYTPIYSARIRHSKTYVDEWLPQPRTLNYSQSDNMVETQYFGENIKGAVERYGTLEKLITFACRNVETIPKSGLKFDDDYCIATVSVEVMQDRFKVTCGLSKRFNRLSKYIGVSSYKRIYEVSERMTQTRENVWTDYVVFTERNTSFLSTAFLGGAFWTHLQSAFIETKRTFPAIGGCKLQGFTKNFKPLNPVILPVISSAEGNTIVLSCSYKDNYSAGQRKIEIDGKTYASEVEYADYYGRVHYLQWSYGPIWNFSGDTADNLPYATTEKVLNPSVSISGSNYQILRKDGAETIKHNVCIQMVADNKNIVIGSALARSNLLVIDEQTKGAKFVVLKTPLSMFDSIIPESKIQATIDITENNFEFIKKIVDYTAVNIGLIFKPPTSSNSIIGKAWALITPRTTKEVTYSTEDGEIITASEEDGGELLIGKNENIFATPDEELGTGFMAFGCHNIYDWIKQKNKE